MDVNFDYMTKAFSGSFFISVKFSTINYKKIRFLLERVAIFPGIGA